MIIIGITGTIGAGKGTIVEYLTLNKGFTHYSVRAFLIEEIKKRGLEVNRDSMVLVANDLRKNHKPSYIIEQLYLSAERSGTNCIIESIRNRGEVDFLKSKANFILFAVDADPVIRYKRIIQRKSETDYISYEVFLENERREMTSTDPNNQNIAECIKLADYIFCNDTSVEKLHKELDNTLLNMKPGT
jgi:dephospho-CoA kinase